MIKKIRQYNDFFKIRQNNDFIFVQGVVKGMSAAMKSMNLEKISGLMDQFEKQFEDLDVQTGVMEGAMSQTTATNIPQVKMMII